MKNCNVNICKHQSDWNFRFNTCSEHMHTWQVQWLRTRVYSLLRPRLWRDSLHIASIANHVNAKWMNRKTNCSKFEYTLFRYDIIRDERCNFQLVDMPSATEANMLNAHSIAWHAVHTNARDSLPFPCLYPVFLAVRAGSDMIMFRIWQFGYWWARHRQSSPYLRINFLQRTWSG